MKQGIYNQTVSVTRPSGSATKHTVIRAYPGHTVTIQGTGNSGRVRITGVSYLTFEGFTITNFQQGLFVDGVSQHIIVRNCRVHDVGQEAIHVKENSSFVTIEGCTIYNTQVIGGCCNGEGIYLGTSSSGPLDNTNNVTARNNTIHHTTDEGIELKPGTHDCVVEGNELYSNNTNISYNQGAIEINQRDNSAQSWTGNPNHIVRNNLIHDNKAGIRLGTGATAYNNVIYNTASSFPGIFADNLNGDSFTRFVYHNTIHMASRGVTVSGATATVLNNIGTTGTNNLAYDAAYFVNAAGRDYHLVPGAAPVNAGMDLRGVVPTDGDGLVRDAQPDLGGQQQVLVQPPAAPQNLRIIP